MAKVLVTGGAGFIGSHVAEQLVQQGHNVVVLDNLSGGKEGNIPEGAGFLPGDITDTKLVDALFKQWEFDYVFHLAAYAAEGLSPFIRHFNYENNLLGSINLINASVRHKVKCFVFTSSIAVYGNKDMVERNAPHPIDPYGISKYAVELDLRAAHDQFGLNHIIFRPHNVYGPKQNLNDKFRNVIGIFMRNKLLGKSVKVFGSGEQTRSFTYIEDIAPVIANSINNKKMYNKVFNIGSDRSYRINTLVKALGIEDVENVESRHEVVHTMPRHNKLRNLVDYPDTPLETGIQRMWEWAQTQHIQEKLENPFKLDITDNFPPSWS